MAGEGAVWRSNCGGGGLGMAALRTGVGVVWGVGAALGEIPLFGPGAGSAASAGMTDTLEAGVTVRARGYDGGGAGRLFAFEAFGAFFGAALAAGG